VGSRPRRALPALCVTQICCWGTLYYAFPVLRADLTADTGWSAASTTAAFSAALVLSAVAGIVVGGVIDRRGPRVVMAAGAVLGAVALVVIAVAANLVVFTLGWLLAGLAMSSTFYQPAFAALTRWYGAGRVRALTTLTLAGGLASTVFAPVTASLTEGLGWRRATLALAAGLLVLPAPLHWFALRGEWPADPGHGHGLPAEPRSSVVRTRPFLLLAAGLTMSGFAMHAVVFGLIPLLTERGTTATTAAWALGLGGAGQTLGRILYAPLAARTTPTVRTAALVLAGGGTTALLATVPGQLPLLVAVVVLAGMVRGNLTLIQATAVTDRWGTTRYGRLSGALVAPVAVAGALAPWAGSALAPLAGGQAALFAWLAGLSTLAAALLTRVRPVLPGS
jgi:MFS family permease